MNQKVKVGVIGCGAISQAYFNGCKQFRILEIKSCADVNMDAARAKAEQNQVQAVTVDELLADPEIQIVINLTIPQAHAKVSMLALNAGKHVHLEKPLAATFEEGAAVVKLAKEKGLRVGCAPDTFLGAGQQTSRKLLDDGYIGRPLAGTAFMLSRGTEHWHQNSEFYYKKGAGPMLDMGPYYLHSLINLLGPVQAVSAVCSRGFETRTITTEVNFGKVIEVEVPTHYSGTLIFANGTVITMCTSFDVFRHGHTPIEIYGSEGSMQVPDPNTFGGPVKVFRTGSENWHECVLTHRYKDNTRGIGVADMAHAIISDRPHRCDASLALHALEVMFAFEESWQKKQVVEITTTCERPAPFPTLTLPGLLD
jgi:predicted dehydrogenase